MLMLPLTPHSSAPGPGGTHGAVPSPPTAHSWPQHRLGGCSPLAVLATHHTPVAATSMWCPSPTQKPISAAPQPGGDSHHPSNGQGMQATAPSALPHPTHSQPQSSCTPLSLSPLISSALTSAWGLLAIERLVH